MTSAPVPSEFENVSTHIRTVHRENSDFYQMLGGALFIGLGVLFGYLLFADPKNYTDYNLSLFTGLLGIFVTVFLLDRLNERRTTKQTIAQEKLLWIAQLGSPDNIITHQAIKVMWMRGWLRDGSVNGANLWEANLEKADLGECDLCGVNLKRANLRNARLWAHLEGASLIDADLTGALLVDPYDPEHPPAYFDEHTTLPDGTQYQPKLGPAQLERFIKPSRIDYFHSDDPRSPAYGATKQPYRLPRQRNKSGMW